MIAVGSDEQNAEANTEITMSSLPFLTPFLTMSKLRN